MKKSFLSLAIKTESGKMYSLAGNSENMYMTFSDGGFPCTYRIEGYSPLAVGKNLKVKYYALTCKGVLKKYQFNSNEPIADMNYHKV